MVIYTPSKSGTVYINTSEVKKDPADEKGFFIDKKSKPSELDNLIKRAGLVVFETAPVLPLFRRIKDKITICPNRITISYNKFLSSYEYPMPIESVTGARVHRDFLFGTLYIDTFGIEKPDPFRYLRINEARLARRYILALIECKKAKIDLPVDDIYQLRNKLKNIGTVRFGTEDASEYHDI
ncbi:hypothetical protein KKB40_05210 [Patescibacteria group bacterium]|nr:hypothetical protein [Patescibacteria group bacterium]